MTMSASLRSAVTSAERKSPSPSRYAHFRSSMSTRPSPETSSGVRVNTRPRSKDLSSSYPGSSVSNSVGV
ncbi:Hypothetical protein PFR_JS21-2_663 [Propionibacterium freudenreichii]|nr:Hypothetical protein PFR_JS21-1_664 [Propionibacterium freudenreichii]SCQ57583.1 Hypothetical protein PFR_JS25-1_521 [Propionibacterium freudenreichii]SCQ60200.1 Hypothetical protein PFR_JS21-2_663 [Propionibacterium freudenreichii]